VAIWAYIAVGGGLLGGALLLRKSKEAAATPAPSSNPCDRLKEAGAPQAVVDACNALRASGVVGAVVGAVQAATESRESKNTTLNGPVVDHIDGAAFDLVAYEQNDGGYGTRKRRPLYGRGIRHQNGCVPIPGHPDWVKCATGTKHIIDNGNFDDPNNYSGDSWWGVVGFEAGYHRTGLLSGGRPKDPYTFRWPDSKPWPASAPQGAGERWVVRGKLIVCPLGTTVNVGTRDHRTEGGPVCTAPSVYVPPPPTVTMPTTEPVRTTTDGGRTADRRDPNR
jgi:hypothetical protein